MPGPETPIVLIYSTAYVMRLLAIGLTTPFLLGSTAPVPVVQLWVMLFSATAMTARLFENL